MQNSLKELREKAIIEITNKIVNNMTMSEVMEVVIRYSEQTAKKAVEGLDEKKLQQIVEKNLSIDKNIKRTPIRKHAGWAGKPSPENAEQEELGKKGGWLNFFNKDKKKHRGWNKEKERETILTRIKKFFNLNE